MARTLRRALAAALLIGALASVARAEDDLDRRRVVAAGELPAVGLFTGAGARCTAFLAGSDRVLVTAAHCVLKGAGVARAEFFEFRPGYRDGASSGLFRARVVAHGDWQEPSDQAGLKKAVSEDWAVLYTDKPTGVPPLLLATNLSSNQLADQQVIDDGYSVDLQNGRFLTQDSCKVTGVEDFRIEHSCRGSPGASGGPLFLANPDGSRGPVIGVNSESNPASTSERLVLTHLRLMSSLRTIPEIDMGGRAIFVGAFVNAVTGLAKNAPNQSAAR